MFHCKSSPSCFLKNILQNYCILGAWHNAQDIVGYQYRFAEYMNGWTNERTDDQFVQVGRGQGPEYKMKDNFTDEELFFFSLLKPLCSAEKGTITILPLTLQKEKKKQ